MFRLFAFRTYRFIRQCLKGGILLVYTISLASPQDKIPSSDIKNVLQGYLKYAGEKYQINVYQDDLSSFKIDSLLSL